MTTQTPRAAAAQTPPALVESSAARGQTPGTGEMGRGSPVPGCHPTLGPASLETVLQALDTAAEVSWERGRADCDRCEAVPCDDHRADIQRGIRFASLATRLRKAAGHD
jgi:hypothetical protein